MHLLIYLSDSLFDCYLSVAWIVCRSVCPTVFLVVNLSESLSFWLSVCFSIYLSIFHVVYLSFLVSVCLIVCVLSVSLYVCLYVCQSVCLSYCLYVCLSYWLSVCLIVRMFLLNFFLFDYLPNCLNMNEHTIWPGGLAKLKDIQIEPDDSTGLFQLTTTKQEIVYATNHTKTLHERSGPRRFVHFFRIIVCLMSSKNPCSVYILVCW